MEEIVKIIEMKKSLAVNSDEEDIDNAWLEKSWESCENFQNQDNFKNQHPRFY